MAIYNVTVCLNVILEDRIVADSEDEAKGFLAPRMALMLQDNPTAFKAAIGEMKIVGVRVDSSFTEAKEVQP